MTVVGPMAVAALGRFRTDLAIIGAKGLSRTAGIMDDSLADAEMERACIASARRTSPVADTSTFDVEGTVPVGAFGLVDALVTEAPPAKPRSRLLAVKRARFDAPGRHPFIDRGESRWPRD